MSNFPNDHDAIAADVGSEITDAAPPHYGAPAPYCDTRSMTVTADTPLHMCPTSLDLTDARQRALAFACGNPGDLEFDSHGVARVRAVHWLIMPDEAEDPETGEIRQFGRLVLIQADGRFFRTTSAFAPRRLRAALELYSPAEWQLGIDFIITRRLSRRGRTYHDFRIAEGGAI